RIEFARIEFEVPVRRADGPVEPQRIFLALEQLAEQIHRVPVNEHTAKVEHGNKRIGHIRSTTATEMAGLWHGAPAGASCALVLDDVDPVAQPRHEEVLPVQIDGLLEGVA